MCIMHIWPKAGAGFIEHNYDVVAGDNSSNVAFRLRNELSRHN